jgi:hypothetical protein
MFDLLMGFAGSWDADAYMQWYFKQVDWDEVAKDSEFTKDLRSTYEAENRESMAVRIQSFLPSESKKQYRY